MKDLFLAICQHWIMALIVMVWIYATIEHVTNRVTAMIYLLMTGKRIPKEGE